LFFMRSVAPKEDYKDRVTNKLIPAVTTTQIYKGAVYFIGIQLIALTATIAFPTLVSMSLDKAPDVNLQTIKIEAETGDYGPAAEDPLKMSKPQPGAGKITPEAVSTPKEEDPMEAVKRSLEQDTKKK
jgi:hypothetical protein